MKKKNEKQTEKPYQTKYNFRLSEYITSKEREYFFFGIFKVLRIVIIISIIIID